MDFAAARCPAAVTGVPQSPTPFHQEVSVSPYRAVCDLAARYRLNPRAARELQRLAGLNAEPGSLAGWLPRGVGVLAAGLAGLGLVLWVAANWDVLGRPGQFAVLQGAVLTLCLGALALPSARSALALLALLAIGGLLAFFGQTYQTGADPWQLFALWAGLCLPLCLAARSDVLWAPWALVAMTAITLWTQAQGVSPWRIGPDDLGVHALAWLLAAVLTLGLSPALRPLTGAGILSLRTAVTLAVTVVTLGALAGLFTAGLAPRYWLGVLVLGAAAAVLATPRGFDIGALSAVVLGIDTLLVAGLGHLLLHDAHGGDPILQLFALGIAAAGLLAGSVSAVLRVAKHQVPGGAA